MNRRSGTRRSRAVATWLAIALGALGAHRFYLHGAGDRLAWLHPLPTLAGLVGVLRLRALGVDDALGSVLVIPLGALLGATLLQAIVYALSSDQRWRERHGADAAVGEARWTTIGAAVIALALGAIVTIATIAFSAQRTFEMLQPAAQSNSRRPSQ